MRSRLPALPRPALLAPLMALATPPVTPATAAAKAVDLSHPFSLETVYWPTEDGFRLTMEAAGMTEAGYYYAANSFCAAEHGGTHVDAPIHFAEGKATVDRIPLERLIAPGVVVDASAKAAADRDYLVGKTDFAGWEERNGRLPDGSILLLRTGWGRFYPDREAYLGTAERGPAAVQKLHFPGLDPKAARWLVANRRVAAIGLDTASIDHGPSRTFEAHRILSQAEIPVFENVANLDLLPANGFRVVALPMKIEGGSGAPLRIVALLD